MYVHVCVCREKVNSPSFGSFLINYMVICDCDCSEDTVRAYMHGVAAWVCRAWVEGGIVECMEEWNCP